MIFVRDLKAKLLSLTCQEQFTTRMKPDERVEESAVTIESGGPICGNMEGFCEQNFSLIDLDKVRHASYSRLKALRQSTGHADIYKGSDVTSSIFCHKSRNRAIIVSPIFEANVSCLVEVRVISNNGEMKFQSRRLNVGESFFDTFPEFRGHRLVLLDKKLSKDLITHEDYRNVERTHPSAVHSATGVFEDCNMLERYLLIVGSKPTPKVPQVCKLTASILTEDKDVRGKLLKVLEGESLYETYPEFKNRRLLLLDNKYSSDVLTFEEHLNVEQTHDVKESTTGIFYDCDELKKYQLIIMP